MRSPKPFSGLASRIVVAALLVALAAIAIIAIGVLVVAQSTFSNLMKQAGNSAAVAHAMFDHGITGVFVAAVVVAAAISVLLAVIFAARLARPLDELARAARRVADGDYGMRLPAAGPTELASLAESFNHMAASLADQERARTEFIVNAAHELRTPLTNLHGYLEALRDGVIEPTPEQFRSLHEEVERLVRLAQSLEILASDGDAGRAAAIEKIDVGEAVRSAIDSARPALAAKSIHVRVHIPERLPAFAAPDRLAAILSNLLQNASRYTPAEGQVAIRAEARTTDVLVSIVNSGDGIPDGDLPHVFERFYRVEKSRDSARGGAGIGLALVKQMVEAGGGQVGVDSEVGSTRFWFSVPA